MEKEVKQHVQVALRLPEQLNDWLEKRSKKNMRSRHNEMLFIFESLRREEEAEKI